VLLPSPQGLSLTASIPPLVRREPRRDVGAAARSRRGRGGFGRADEPSCPRCARRARGAGAETGGRGDSAAQTLAESRDASVAARAAHGGAAADVGREPPWPRRRRGRSNLAPQDPAEVAPLAAPPRTSGRIYRRRTPPRSLRARAARRTESPAASTSRSISTARNSPSGRRRPTSSSKLSPQRASCSRTTLRLSRTAGPAAAAARRRRSSATLGTTRTTAAAQRTSPPRARTREPHKTRCNPELGCQ